MTNDVRDIIATQNDKLPRNMKTKWKWLGGFYAIVRWCEVNLHIGGKEVARNNPVPVEQVSRASAWLGVNIGATGRSGKIQSNGARQINILLMTDEAAAAVILETSDEGETWYELGHWDLKPKTSLTRKIECGGYDLLRFVTSGPLLVKFRFIR